MPLEIEDKPAMTIQAIRLAAEKIKRRSGLGLIVVDYLQPAKPDRERESRTVDITEVSAGLKAVAKALDVPVLALAQLSRAVEQRDDKRPQLADLRDSGAIEQDADQVLFLYRDEYYASRQEPDPRMRAMPIGAPAWTAPRGCRHHRCKESPRPYWGCPRVLRRPASTIPEPLPRGSAWLKPCRHVFLE